MIILRHRAHTPHTRFLLEAQLLISRHRRRRRLTFLKNAFRVGGLAVSEGGWLHGGEAALVETRIADGGADGRGGDGCAGKGRTGCGFGGSGSGVDGGDGEGELGTAGGASKHFDGCGGGGGGMIELNY